MSPTMFPWIGVASAQVINAIPVIVQSRAGVSNRVSDSPPYAHPQMSRDDP